MATIRVLQDCVIAHRRRIPGELVDMDEYTARRIADESPETFEWVDRPVQQFVDVQPAAPVSEDKAQKPARKLKKAGGLGGMAVEVSDANESTG